MAIRTGAGTGVIVSLVVFVLATVFLLVLSIVFYAGKIKQMEVARDAQDTLSEYVTSAERSSDTFQNMSAVAATSRQSVAGYLNAEVEELKRIVSGSPTSTLEQIRNEFGSALEGGSLALSFDRLQRQVSERQQEVDARVAELTDSRRQIEELKAELAAARLAGEDAVASAKAQWEDIHGAAIEHSRSLDELFLNRGQRDDRLRGSFQGRILQLQDENDDLLMEKAQLASTIEELRQVINAGRISPQDPAMLVDGRVLEVTGNDRVFIDRGGDDRIVLGMTFEIYTDFAQLIPDADGDLPRGKASVEVIKVGDTTSTAKVTRSTPGRPIVRDDVIVNAVYDPDYRYKFLVHGVFDADGDGRGEADNTFVKDRIGRWGGTVVEDQVILPGDLDFLVLGIQPREPRPLPRNASPLMEEEYVRQKQAFLDYMDLFEQAREAKIPVLNATRLDVLTGHVGR